MPTIKSYHCLFMGVICVALIIYFPVKWWIVGMGISTPWFVGNETAYGRNVTAPNRKRIVAVDAGVPMTPKPWEKHRYIYPTFKGKFGNMAWEYAALYALAKQTGRNPFMCKSELLLTIFKELSVPMHNKAYCSSIPKRLKIHLSTEPRAYNPKFKAKIGASNMTFVEVESYFQNSLHFKEFEWEIRKEFVIRNNLQDVAQKYLRQLARRVAAAHNGSLTQDRNGVMLMNGMPFVFVNFHVRGTELRWQPWKFNVPTPEYFKQAMHYFRVKYGPNVVFNVITKDYVWSDEMIRAKDAYYIRPKGAMFSDFAIGVTCNHSILTIGTFGWWMAFLSRGDVVYYKAKPTTQILRAYYEPAYYLPGWIGLPKK